LRATNLTVVKHGPVPRSRLAVLLLPQALPQPNHPIPPAQPHLTAATAECKLSAGAILWTGDEVEEGLWVGTA